MIAGLLVAFLAGAALAALFFGGLRFTIQRLPTARRPMLLAGGSVLIRTVVVVAGFVWVGDGEWQRYVAALLGFLLVRLVLVRLWGPTARSATTR